MSADSQLLAEIIEPGRGLALDLGGGTGVLRGPLEERGYRYLNMDREKLENGEPSLIGDAHTLPFRDSSLDLVVSKDSLEHFLQPWAVINEVHRVLKLDSQLIILVPFLHPFHGDDYYRYSPLGLRHLLTDFEIVSFDSPLWVFTVLGLALVEALKRMHLGFAERPIRQMCAWLDRRVCRQGRPASFAAAYRVVARKRETRH